MTPTSSAASSWAGPPPAPRLTGEYSPLEAGLAWACAENKGCYTGQEIIARQITYDKVTRSWWACAATRRWPWAAR